MPRVGILMYGSAANAAHRVDAFIGAMRELGYEQGRNIVYEKRTANGQDDLLVAQARELARGGADIVLSGSGPATQALKRVNATLPVVMAAVADPVVEGFAHALDKPGTNFTGLASGVLDHLSKHLELLFSVAPRLSRVTALLDPSEALYPSYRARLQAAMRAGTRLVEVDATTPDQMERAFPAARREDFDGLLVTGGTLFYNERRAIAEMAAHARRPAIYPLRGFVEAGGLMSWGPNPEANFARAAVYVDKILRGAKPSELPVEPPVKLELVVNREALRDLGLTLPPEAAKQAVLIG